MHSYICQAPVYEYQQPYYFLLTDEETEVWQVLSSLPKVLWIVGGAARIMSGQTLGPTFLATI